MLQVNWASNKINYLKVKRVAFIFSNTFDHNTLLVNQFHANKIRTQTISTIFHVISVYMSLDIWRHPSTESNYYTNLISNLFCDLLTIFFT